MLAFKNNIQVTPKYFSRNGLPVIAIIGPQNTILQVWSAQPGYTDLQYHYSLSHELHYHPNDFERSSAKNHTTLCQKNGINPALPINHDKGLQITFNLAKDNPEMFLVLPEEETALTAPSSNQPNLAYTPAA